MPFGFRSRRRRKKQLEEERREIRSEYQERIEKIPSEYPYFCRKCLYQSKSREKICPVCGAKMSRVGYDDRDGLNGLGPEPSSGDEGGQSESAPQTRHAARKRRTPARRRKIPRSTPTSASSASTATRRSTRTSSGARSSATALASRKEPRASAGAPVSTVGIRCEICDQRRPDIRHQCGAGFCLPCLRRWFNMLPPAMQRKRLCPECNRKLEIGLTLVLEDE